MGKGSTHHRWERRGGHGDRCDRWRWQRCWDRSNCRGNRRIDLRSGHEEQELDSRSRLDCRPARDRYADVPHVRAARAGASAGRDAIATIARNAASDRPMTGYRMRYLTAVFILALASTAWSQPPTPGRGNVQQTQQQQPEAQGRAAGIDQSIPAPSGVNVTINNQPGATVPQQQPQRETDQRFDSTSSNGWITGASIVAAFFTAVIAVYTWKLWAVGNTQAKIIADTLTTSHDLRSLRCGRWVGDNLLRRGDWCRHRRHCRSSLRIASRYHSDLSRTLRLEKL
jgi:hypothetical protein